MGFKFASEQKAVYSGLISTFNTEPLNDLNTANNQVLIQSVPMHYQINNYYCGPAWSDETYIAALSSLGIRSFRGNRSLNKIMKRNKRNGRPAND